MNHRHSFPHQCYHHPLNKILCMKPARDIPITMLWHKHASFNSRSHYLMVVHQDGATLLWPSACVRVWNRSTFLVDHLMTLTMNNQSQSALEFLRPPFLHLVSLLYNILTYNEKVASSPKPERDVGNNRVAKCQSMCELLYNWLHTPALCGV